MFTKEQKRYKRHRKIRAKISGTAKVPRLCVFKSSKHIYAQLVDDEKGKTILSAKDQEIKNTRTKKEGEKKEHIEKGKTSLAYQVGKIIAQKALENKIDKVVFDRGGYKYHGRVEALAKGAREGGLKF